MKRYCLFILCFSAFQYNHGFSQSTPSQLINEVKSLEIRNAPTKMEYNNFEGTPFYKSQFINSTVYYFNGNYASVPLRYDLYMDEMEFKQGTEVYWLIKEDIKLIKYGTDMLFTAPLPDDNSKLSFYFISDLGRNKLFYRKSVNLSQYVEPKGYAGPVPASFGQNEDEYYIAPEGKRIKKVKTNKDLKTIFDGNQAALEFLRKEKLKADKFEDLKKLISFVNGK